MKDVTNKNFGVIIALLLPGFVLLWGLSFSNDEVKTLLEATSKDESRTIGGFFYVTLASLSAGLLLSAVRWLIVDHLLVCCCRVPKPNFSFAHLEDPTRYAIFLGVVENHYRYYQYYSNTLVAIIVAFIAYLRCGDKGPSCMEWTVVASLLIALFFASRDSMKKYHERGKQILQEHLQRKDDDDKRMGEEEEEEDS